VEQIHIPDGWLGGQALDADSTLSLGAWFADPHHSELGLIVVVLHVENLACLHRANHSVQHGSMIADVSDLGMLRERHGLGVDTPDTHRQECGDTSIAATIHKAPLSPTPKKIWHVHSD
jgi:hypothetical protein